MGCLFHPSPCTAAVWVKYAHCDKTMDGFFHEYDLKDECLRAGLKNAMHDFAGGEL